ncbi:hypothetical protein V1525DRAFT_394091 [Lipomyces kononenkoae]|uniref:Uncharacterized protein n=1 Tax=Lipomyces kononenkoae TaxID=34357 RepID=A0ACC3TAX9_LIPKO
MPSTSDYQEHVDLLRRSSDGLRIAYTTSSSFLTSPTGRVKSLIVFDSSFNPPTVAHLELLTRTIANSTFVSVGSQANVLLLLAVQNADKPTAPAPLPDRLSMMERFSFELAPDTPDNKAVNVAVGITKYPRFVDKAQAVFDTFPGVEEQIYLTGYDTLIRLLDGKYYPDQTLQEALGDFMSRCKIVCYIRDNKPKWGTAAEQVQFVEDIRAGKKTDIPQHWANRIWLLSYASHDDVSGGGGRHNNGLDLSIVSSTAARDASRYGKVRFVFMMKCRISADGLRCLTKE